ATRTEGISNHYRPGFRPAKTLSQQTDDHGRLLKTSWDITLNHVWEPIVLNNKLPRIHPLFPPLNTPGLIFAPTSSPQAQSSNCRTKQLTVESLHPQPEHQNIPELGRAVAHAGLMLRPHPSDKGTGKEGIILFDEMVVSKFPDPPAKPSGEGDGKTHLVAINNLGRQTRLQRLLEDVLSNASPQL